MAKRSKETATDDPDDIPPDMSTREKVRHYLNQAQGIYLSLIYLQREASLINLHHASEQIEMAANSIKKVLGNKA